MMEDMKTLSSGSFERCPPLAQATSGSPAGEVSEAGSSSPQAVDSVVRLEAPRRRRTKLVSRSLRQV